MYDFWKADEGWWNSGDGNSQHKELVILLVLFLKDDGELEKVCWMKSALLQKVGVLARHFLGKNIE